jgi:hypothetical protein
MTGSRIAHLRSVAERDKAAKLAEERFVETFSRVPNEVTAYREVLRRITQRRYGYDGDFDKLHKKEQERLREEWRLLPRRAEKLQLVLTLGLKPTSVHDVLFLSELTPEEARLSDSKWEQFLEEGRKRKPIVTSPQVGAAKKKSVTVCAVCQGSFEPKRADSLYCSPKCKARASTAKRPKTRAGRSVMPRVQCVTPDKPFSDKNGLVLSTT